MISYEYASLCTLAVYFTSSVSGLTGMITRKTWLQKAGCALCALALLLQTIGLLTGFHKNFTGGLSGGAYLQMVAWFVALISLVLWGKFKQKTAVLFAAPLCTLLFTLSIPYISKVQAIPESLGSSFYVLHIGALFLSLALMAVSCIASLLFLFIDSRIKSKKPVKGFLTDMPALNILDKINGFCIVMTFPLYTVGIAAGLLRAKPVYGATFTGDPKELVSLLVWAALAFVFHNRLARSWTGRKPALTMLCIFFTSLFSLLIINTVMDTHHAFLIN
ncbi:MAG: cytochrome c biogenesis protein CcsA [Desulfovibrionaceae bacterium]|nr:cytochrome c biogenesis protein CcsA [Desulfovibrionaceae bacterium]